MWKIIHIPIAGSVPVDMLPLPSQENDTVKYPLRIGYQKLSSLAVFAIGLAILWWNAAPSVTFHDSSEFAIAAKSAGIPHPPGAPTWTALAALFVRLGGFADPARGTNLLSGLLGAIALGLICLLAQRWASRLFPTLSRSLVILAGITPVAVMLHSSAFLEQAFTTEQYTLLVALIAGMLLTATALLLGEVKDPGKNLRLFGLLGLLWGLAIGNHLSQVSLVFLVGWAVLAGAPKGKRLASSLYALGGLFAGLLVFAWLPIRSHANPIIDFCNVRTLDRFIWAIQRKQWKYHSLDQTPPDFAAEWIRSYAFGQQIGWIALVFAVVGLVVALKRRPVLAGWLAAVSIPYAAGMILGHMKQNGMDVSYIKSYGVVDWHLPIYLAIAMAAGLGIAWFAGMLTEKSTGRAAVFFSSLIVLILVGTAIPVISSQSLRGFRAPDEYLNALTKRLPKQAIVVPGEDNAFGALTYWSYVSHPDPRRWVILRTASIAKNIRKNGSGGVWTLDAKRKYFTVDNMDLILQPFRIPPVPEELLRNAPIFIDYSPGLPAEARYLLPDGMLFRVMDRPTTNEEVLKAEAAWQKESPELLRSPDSNSHRLERHAWAVLHRERGSFFATRGLWNEAAGAYRRSLGWINDDGQIWFNMAYALEQTGNTDAAILAYRQAMGLVPNMKGVRQNLAILVIGKGDLDEARRLLEEELKLDPTNQAVQHNLTLLRNER